MNLILNDEAIDAPEFKKAFECKINCSKVKTTTIQIEFKDTKEKAIAFRQSKRIRIDPNYWESMTAEGKSAVLGHEIAHILGADCHRCADYYAGRFIRSLGNDPINSMKAIKQYINRNDYSDFERGMRG